MIEEEMEFEPSKEDLQQLREWIAKSPHIIQDYDDTVLSAFVRGCKGSLEKTKRILEGFNSLGQRYPEIMKNYDPLDQRLLDHLSESLMFTLPKKTPDGSIVFLGKLRDCEGFKNDPYKAHNTDYFRYWILSVYVYLWENKFGPGKWILVGDCKGSTLLHSRELTPVLVKQGLEMMRNALPVRVQNVHLLNVPPYMEFVFNFAKAVAKKKVSDRIHLHSTRESFYRQFPRDILPKDYGGDEETSSILHDRWYDKVKSFRPKFLEEESKMRRLDPLRPKNYSTEEMAGTFKSLNVD